MKPKSKNPEESRRRGRPKLNGETIELGAILVSEQTVRCLRVLADNDDATMAKIRRAAYEYYIMCIQ